MGFDLVLLEGAEEVVEPMCRCSSASESKSTLRCWIRPTREACRGRSEQLRALPVRQIRERGNRDGRVETFPEIAQTRRLT